MEGNTYSHPTWYQVLTILVFYIFPSLSNTISASACNTTVASNHTNTPSDSSSTQSKYTNTPSTSSTQSNYTNTPNDSSSTQSNNTNTPSSSSSTQSNYTNSSNNPSCTQIYKTYIITNCNSSTYPSICYQALYPYASKIEADPLKLCNTSLLLALKAARKASSILSDILETSNLTETKVAAIKDCLSNAKDSMEELQQSLDAMGHLDEIDTKFWLSSIQTWVSAAITDDETCYDVLDEQNVGGAMRDKIRNSIFESSRMTSNALYFINNLSYY